jgi:hypothetical protein
MVFTFKIHIHANTWFVSMVPTTTGKTLVVVQRISAVRRGMAKTALPSDVKAMHGKENAHGKDVSERTAKNDARQRDHRTHDKDTPHDKEGTKRTAKKICTVKAHSFAMAWHFVVRHAVMHGKGPFAL